MTRNMLPSNSIDNSLDSDELNAILFGKSLLSSSFILDRLPAPKDISDVILSQFGCPTLPTRDQFGVLMSPVILSSEVLFYQSKMRRKFSSMLWGFRTSTLSLASFLVSFWRMGWSVGRSNISIAKSYLRCSKHLSTIARAWCRLWTKARLLTVNNCMADFAQSLSVRDFITEFWKVCPRFEVMRMQTSSIGAEPALLANKAVAVENSQFPLKNLVGSSSKLISTGIKFWSTFPVRTVWAADFGAGLSGDNPVLHPFRYCWAVALTGAIYSFGASVSFEVFSARGAFLINHVEILL